MIINVKEFISYNRTYNLIYKDTITGSPTKYEALITT